MRAPAILIRFDLEAAPQLQIDALTDRDHDRLVDWIKAHPRYLRLIQEALRLERKEKAA